MSKFLLKLRVKGCEKAFSEDLGPGVLAIQEVTFDRDVSNLWTAVGLVEQERLFIQEMIEVQIEEVNDEGSD